MKLYQSLFIKLLEYNISQRTYTSGLFWFIKLEIIYLRFDNFETCVNENVISYHKLLFLILDKTNNVTVDLAGDHVFLFIFF